MNTSETTRTKRSQAKQILFWVVVVLCIGFSPVVACKYQENDWIRETATGVGSAALIGGIFLLYEELLEERRIEREEARVEERFRRDIKLNREHSKRLRDDSNFDDDLRRLEYFLIMDVYPLLCDAFHIDDRQIVAGKFRGHKQKRQWEYLEDFFAKSRQGTVLVSRIGDAQLTSLWETAVSFPENLDARCEPDGNVRSYGCTSNTRREANAAFHAVIEYAAELRRKNSA